MIIQVQILSKILQTGNNGIVEDNLLTSDYFEGYKEEFDFIQDHIKKYGNVPDKATFLEKFDFDLVDVTESDNYLVETIREAYLYYKSVPIIQKAAELLKTDSNAASEFLISEMKNLQPNYNLGGVDIIADAQDRYEQFLERRDHQNDCFFTCGFKELDDIWHGIQREEELVVIFARTNQGKSWVLEKMCTHITNIGFNVGYISPEMSASSIGYRYDTLNDHISNSSLVWGKKDLDEAEYKKYIDGLSEKKSKFIVSTPLDFDKKITVSKIKTWINQYKLDCVAIDGITYIDDERFKRGDSKTTSLTNISEDLMGLSMELKVPILVVVQANRTGVVDKDSEDVPELESIRDSDGISHNASKVLSIRQNDGKLQMGIKKQRFGRVGDKLTYQWDIDKGDFIFIPTFDDGEDEEVTREKVDKVKKSYSDKEDVF